MQLTFDTTHRPSTTLRRSTRLRADAGEGTSDQATLRSSTTGSPSSFPMSPGSTVRAHASSAFDRGKYIGITFWYASSSVPSTQNTIRSAGWLSAPSAPPPGSAVLGKRMLLKVPPDAAVGDVARLYGRVSPPDRVDGSEPYCAASVLIHSVEHPPVTVEQSRLCGSLILQVIARPDSMNNKPGPIRTDKMYARVQPRPRKKTCR